MKKIYFHINLKKWKYNSPREEKIEDSLLVEGKHVPDPKLTVKTSEGHIIPLGKIIPKEIDPKEKHAWYWYNQYSEYVVPKEENIMVRYVIRLGDGTKEYTRKDLYMIDGDEKYTNGLDHNDDDDMDFNDEDHDSECNEGDESDNDSFESS